MTEDDRWIAFAYRGDHSARAAEIGDKETRHEEDRCFEAAGLSRLSHHATKPKAKAAARDMLDRLRAGSPSIPWCVCFANPCIDGTGSGRCYFIESPPPTS